jgi:endonuclease-3
MSIREQVSRLPIFFAESEPAHRTLNTGFRSAVVATAPEKREAVRVVRALGKDYPEASCSLQFETPLQLLIATILSAQCTDQRVNMVTAELFEKYPAAADFAVLRITTLERAIKSTGFFRNKAKNIKACCRELVDRYDGEVPADLDQLVQLAGVGRKTANVVLGNAFGIASGVVVDTHVTRISRRLGLTREHDAVKIEADLNALLPKKEWIDFSHRMIRHGRKVCVARKPRCEQCSMQRYCPQVGVG